MDSTPTWSYLQAATDPQAPKPSCFSCQARLLTKQYFTFTLIILSSFAHNPHPHSPIRRSVRYPSLVQLPLQPRNLLQTLRIPNHLLDPLLLLLRQLDPIRFPAGAGGRRGAVEVGGGGGDVEGVRFDAHYLS